MSVMSELFQEYLIRNWNKFTDKDLKEQFGWDDEMIFIARNEHLFEEGNGSV